MIDFNTSQLSWIIVSTLSIGGAGYIKIESNIQEIDTKVVVAQTKLLAVDDKLAALQTQLTRIESKIDKQGTK